MSKALKILIVASWYKDENNPVAGSFIEEQARLLQKKGHSVTVLHPFLKGTFLGTINNRKTDQSSEDDNGIKTIRIGVSPSCPKLRFLSYKKLINKCISYFDSNDSLEFDLVHSHAMFMGGVVALGLSENWNIPFFHTEHTSGFIFYQEQYTSSDKRIIKRVIHHSSSTFFVSNFALEKFHAWLGDFQNTRVLHNLVASIFFNTTLVNTVIESKRVCMICSLNSVKRVDLAIRMFGLIERDGVTLCIYGDGPEKSDLERLILDLNLQNCVSIFGKLDRGEVLNNINGCDVLISTSKIETFGLTVAEAQALGKPVVVTDSGGVRDIVEDDTGLICESEIKSIANSIQQVINDLERYDANKIRKITQDKFGEDKIYNQLLHHYSQVLNLEV